jgi:hypothetical protein
MTHRYPKTNKTTIKITMEQLLRLLAESDPSIPKGLPSLVRVTLQDDLEITWKDVEPTSPF